MAASSGGMIKELLVGVSLAFDKSGFNQAETAVGSLLKDLRNFSLTVSAAAASLFGLAEVSGSHSRELKNTASQLGISTDKLQELGYAAKVTANVTQDELVGSLEGLSKTLFESRNVSSDASRTLTAFGVSVETLNNPLATSDQVLSEIADIFASMPDGIQKTAYANEIFGASGAKMLPFLSQGASGMKKLSAEAHSMGIVLGKGFIDQGAAYEKRMTQVWMVLKNITYVIGGQLMKYLLPLVDTFQKFITQNQKLISMDISIGLKAIGEVLKYIGRAAMGFMQVLIALIPHLGGIANFGKIIAVAFAAFTAGPLVTGLMALGLVIQDIYTYFKGGDSYFGDFIKWCNKLFNTVKGFYIFKLIGSWIKEALDFITPFAEEIDRVLGITDKLHDLMAMLTNEVPKKAEGIASSIGNALKGAAHWAMYGPDKAAAADQSIKGASKWTGGQEMRTGMTGLTPAMAGAGGGSGPITMSTQVTVQVPPGTSPGDASNMVSNGVEDGLSKHLKAIRNQKSGGRKN